MLRSMTGIGVGVDEDARRRVTVEARSVNHRHLKFSFKAPPALLPLEAEIEALLRTKHARGAFTANVVVRTPAGLDAALKLDVDAVSARVAELHAIAGRLHTTLSDAEALGFALKLPGAMRGAEDEAPVADDSLRVAVLRAAERAFDALDQCRAAEGAKTGGWLRERAAEAARLRATIAERMPEAVRALRDKFVQRLNALIAETRPGLAATEEAVIREAATLAERMDVAEEVDRLGGHLEHFEGILKDGKDAGRRLDFLLQEMLRETNTIGSKASDLAVAHAVVALKSEIEKLKEQVQNLE